MCEAYPRGGKDFLRNKITPSTSPVTWLPPLRRQVWKCQCCQLWGVKISHCYQQWVGKNFPPAPFLKKAVLPTVLRENVNSLRRHIWNSQCCQMWVGKIKFPPAPYLKCQCSQLWEVKIPFRRRDCSFGVGRNSVVMYEKKKRRETVCRYVRPHFSDRWGRPALLGRAKIEFEIVASKRVD